MAFKAPSPFARSRPHQSLNISEAAPSLFGSKAGHIPIDIEQATGLERLQLIGQLHGVDLFNMGPLLITKPGALADPTLVPACVRGGF